MTTITVRSITSCRWVAVAAALALSPIVSMAQPPSHTALETVSTKISFSDLDLSGTAGQHAAQDRLSAAAQNLCKQFSDTRKVDNAAALEDCYRDTLGTSLRQLSAQVAVAVSKGGQLALNRQ